MNHNQFYQESAENHVVEAEEDKGEEEEEEDNSQRGIDYRRSYGRINPQRPPPPPPPPKRTASSSSLAEATIHEYGKLGGKVGESSRQHPRIGLRGAGGGEIVEVHGGHIVRSIGRKDRHSKVCTAKGPRDRRVRLAAHTAIQFYDVQDRLGYDRPSKAVDWLIKKAKSAIDELAQLPAWHPSSCSWPNDEEEARPQQLGFRQSDLGNSGNSGKRAIGMIDGEHGRDNANHRNLQDSTFLPPSLDSDAIADTIKSFFPMAAASAAANSSAMEFHNFQSPNLLPRNTPNSQDLRLSLQSIHDPIMLHHHNPPPSHQNPNSQTEPPPILLTGPPLGFDATSAWPDWNSGGDSGSAAASGGIASGFLFHSPPVVPQPLIQQLLSHNQFLSQRGPLQSSNSPSIRAWMDPSDMADNSQQQQQQQGIVPVYPSSMSAIGYAGGFPGFHIPARIQGDEEEEHDGYSDKPSSASSDSRH